MYWELDSEENHVDDENDDRPIAGDVGAEIDAAMAALDGIEHDGHPEAHAPERPLAPVQPVSLCQKVALYWQRCKGGRLKDVQAEISVDSSWYAKVRWGDNTLKAPPIYLPKKKSNKDDCQAGCAYLRELRL